MEELLREALAPSVTIEEFFTTYVPRIHAQRRDEFARASQVPVIVSVWFTDIDERYTVEVSAEKVKVEHGDMVDFPVATIVGESAQWEGIKERLLKLTLELERQRDALHSKYGSAPLTQRIKDDFESKRGIIGVTIDGMKLDFVLNDYEPEAKTPRFDVSVSSDALLKVLRGEVAPRDMASHVQVSGQVSFALEIAGFFGKHFKL